MLIGNLIRCLIYWRLLNNILCCNLFIYRILICKWRPILNCKLLLCICNIRTWRLSVSPCLNRCLLICNNRVVYLLLILKRKWLLECTYRCCKCSHWLLRCSYRTLICSYRTSICICWLSICSYRTLICKRCYCNWLSTCSLWLSCWVWLLQ